MVNTAFDPCISPMLASKLSKLFNLPIFCFLLGGPVQSNLGAQEETDERTKGSGPELM